MSYDFGKHLRVSVFGQSHGEAIGMIMDGLPAGEAIDMDELQRFMERRAPGRNALSTARKEPDRPRFLSGLLDSTSCGAPICAVIENKDTRSSDYNELRDVPRPGHADYTAWVKWKGQADMRGGGQFSGRLTAPLCIAGGICKQVLARKGIYVGAHLSAVAGICDADFPLFPSKESFDAISSKAFPVLSEEAGAKMQEAIAAAAAKGDSVGGVIECAVIGLPAGLGGPLFEGVEGRLAQALFGISAVKGVEFGAGFRAASMKGSENNDPFSMIGGDILCRSNNAGGILGGITNGMPLTLRCAIKPTPSIARSQSSVSLSRRENTVLEIKGRHDPCIAHRAVPVVEAVTAAVVLDMILEENFYGNH